MTEQQRQISLQTEKLQLSFWAKVAHFGIVGFLLFIPLLFVFFHVTQTKNQSPKPLENVELFILILPVVLGLFFYRLQLKKLRFREVLTELPRQELDDIIEKVGTALKWYPEEISIHMVIAKTHPSFFSGSWGEQITILFDTNRILVNSICDPDKGASVASMGRNRKNVNKLIEEIETANRKIRFAESLVSEGRGIY
jgi:hypothetical protein